MSHLYKEQAARLSEHLAATHGIKLKHQSALNAVAALHGARNWNTLVTQGSSPELATAGPASPPTPSAPAKSSVMAKQALLKCWSAEPPQHPVLRTLREQRLAHFGRLPPQSPFATPYSPGRNAGGILGRTREGSASVVDVHREEGSSVSILGMNGSGKTYLLQELMCDTLRRGGTVHALSYGRDHQTLCKLLGGRHIEIAGKTALGLNPFGSCSDKDFAPKLLPLLAELLLEVLSFYLPDARWTNTSQRAAIEAALRVTWDFHGRNSTFEQVLNELAECQNSHVIAASHLALADWDTLGPWLDKRDATAMDAFQQPLAVFEFEQLHAKAVVHRMAYMLVALHSAIASWSKPRDVPMLFVMDETDALLRALTRPTFWQTVQQQLHQNGGGVALTAQQVPLANSPSCLSVLVEGAPTTVFTYARAVDVTPLSSQQPWQTIAGLVDAVRGLVSPSYKGAEFVALQSGIVHTMRLELDPYSEFLFSTRASLQQSKRVLTGTPEEIDAGLRRLVDLLPVASPQP